MTPISWWNCTQKREELGGQVGAIWKSPNILIVPISDPVTVRAYTKQNSES